MVKSINISERDFSTQVEDLLKIFSWRWCHFRPAQTQKGWRTALSGDKGLPDYIAVRPPRLLFAELKDRLSKTIPEQEGWLEDLRECVKYITLEPVPVHKAKIGSLSWWENESKLIPSFEVYLWRPADIDEVANILKGE